MNYSVHMCCLPEPLVRNCCGLQLHSRKGHRRPTGTVNEENRKGRQSSSGLKLPSYGHQENRRSGYHSPDYSARLAGLVNCSPCWLPCSLEPLRQCPGRIVITLLI